MLLKNGAIDKAHCTLLAEDSLKRTEYAYNLTVENLISKNESESTVLDKSGSLASTLGRAQENGFKPVTNKSLPGSYGG